MPTTRDQRPYNVAYYAKNREVEIARVTPRQHATLAWLRELRRVPCLDCGRRLPPYAMDFDHRDPADKSFNLGAGKVLLKSRAALVAEIAKCDVVCANCHRIRTQRAFASGTLRPASFIRKPDAEDLRTQRARLKSRRLRTSQAALLRAFRRAPCMDCGEQFPWFVLEFDHREGREKAGLVPQMAGRVSLMRLLEEIEKCDIVCANCHRIRTYARRVMAAAIRGCVVALAHDSSKVEVRVRLPSPALECSIEEPRIEYRLARIGTSRAS